MVTAPQLALRFTGTVCGTELASLAAVAVGVFIAPPFNAGPPLATQHSGY